MRIHLLVIFHSLLIWNSLNLVTVFVLLHTVPVLYEKYEDKVDDFAEKAMIEIKQQYAVFDTKVLSKIPRGPLKDKKKAWEVRVSE